MEYDEILDEQLAGLDLDELEKALDEATEQSDGPFSGLSTDEIMHNLLEGKPLFDSEVIVQNLLDLFLLEIKAGLLLAIEVTAICIFLGLMKNFSNTFGEKTVSSLGALVCGFLVIALCLNNFIYTYELCCDAVDTMARTMQILLPILIPLMITMGGFASGSVLNPVILGAVTAVNTIMQKFILPAIFLSAIFTMINSLTEKDYVKKLAAFLRNAALFATGLCVTLFSGLTAVQGIAVKSADGLLANTARYSMDNFIPIVGGFAADSIDMVISCIGIIKNGVGIIGIIVIICFLVTPLLKTLTIAVIYKITAIITEPIGTKQISDCLSEMGTAVVIMAIVIFLTALMFLIFITIVIGIGGGNLWK